MHVVELIKEVHQNPSLSCTKFQKYSGPTRITNMDLNGMTRKFSTLEEEIISSEALLGDNL